MQKLMITVFTVAALSLCAMPTAFSQPVFGQNFQAQSNLTAPRGGRAQPNPVMSSSDFGSMVTTMDSQTKNRLADQYNQQLNQQKQLNASANAAAKKQEDTTPNAATSIMNPSPSDQLNFPQGAPGNMPPRGTPNTAPNQPNVTQPNVNLPPAPLGVPPAQQQPQVYTGFGAGTQNNAPIGSAPRPNTQRPNTAPAQSGGWNIQY